MEKIINNEILDSCKSTLKKRIDSSVYGTYVIYWLVFHWDFIFTIFFVSEDKIWDSMNLFKNDYLVKTFFNYHQASFYVFWIIPAILTFLTIWVMPKYIIIPAFKKEEENETEKMIFKLREQKKIESALTELENEKTKKFTAVVKKVEEQQKVKEVDPTISWDDDYLRFKKLTFAYKFQKIIESYYRKQGDIVDYDQYGNNVTFEIPEDILAYSHSNDLVEIDHKSNKINMTAKGRYFINKYLEDPNKPNEFTDF